MKRNCNVVSTDIVLTEKDKRFTKISTTEADSAKVVQQSVYFHPQALAAIDPMINIIAMLDFDSAKNYADQFVTELQTAALYQPYTTMSVILIEVVERSKALAAAREESSKRQARSRALATLLIVRRRLSPRMGGVPPARTLLFPQANGRGRGGGGGGAKGKGAGAGKGKGGRGANTAASGAARPPRGCCFAWAKSGPLPSNLSRAHPLPMRALAPQGGPLLLTCGSRQVRRLRRQHVQVRPRHRRGRQVPQPPLGKRGQIASIRRAFLAALRTMAAPRPCAGADSRRKTARLCSMASHV